MFSFGSSSKNFYVSNGIPLSLSEEHGLELGEPSLHNLDIPYKGEQARAYLYGHFHATRLLLSPDQVFDRYIRPLIIEIEAWRNDLAAYGMLLKAAHVAKASLAAAHVTTASRPASSAAPVDVDTQAQQNTQCEPDDSPKKLEEMQRQKELLFKHFVKWKQAQDTTGQDEIYEQVIAINVEISRLELKLDKSQAAQHAEIEDEWQGYENTDQQESDYNPVEDADDEMDEGESDSRVRKLC